MAQGVAAKPQTTGSSPLESEPGGGTEEKMEQSVCGVATDPEEANTDKTVNPTKGSLQCRLQRDACRSSVQTRVGTKRGDSFMYLL